jgi:hypothetical protein
MGLKGFSASGGSEELLVPPHAARRTSRANAELAEIDDRMAPPEHAADH